jgi:hypothetical protein
MPALSATGDAKMRFRISSVCGPDKRTITRWSLLGELIAAIVSLELYTFTKRYPLPIIRCYLHFEERFRLRLFNFAAGFTRYGDEVFGFNQFLFGDVPFDVVLFEDAAKDAGHNIKIQAGW